MRPPDQITMSVPTLDRCAHLRLSRCVSLSLVCIVAVLIVLAPSPRLHCSRSHRHDGSDLMQWQGDEDQMRVSLLD